MLAIRFWHGARRSVGARSVGALVCWSLLVQLVLRVWSVGVLVGAVVTQVACVVKDWVLETRRLHACLQNTQPPSRTVSFETRSAACFC